MSKLDAKVFSSITPFAKQWILGDELMYEFLNQYQDFLSESYGIIDLGSLDWIYGNVGGTNMFYSTDAKLRNFVKYHGDGKCSIFTATQKIESSLTDKEFTFGNSSAYTVLYINDSAYTDADTFKAAMQGVYLIFELADNIGRVNLGNETGWMAQTNGIYKPYPAAKAPSEVSQAAKIYVAGYQTIAGVNWNSLISADPTVKVLCISVAGNLNAYAPGLTTANAAQVFKNKYLYYEKA